MTKNARAVLKQFVEAIEQDDISPTMSTGFEKAYQNALAVLQEPDDTAPAEAKAVGFDFRAHMQRQRDFSEKTFGPGQRTTGVVDHIRKELREIEANPTDLTEWIDVVILALDGAWRAGGNPEQIIATLVAKQTKNESRNWPDWRTADPNKAIEHVRTGDEQKPFEPAFDMPTTAAQALATIQRWGNPTCMTFQHSKAARAYALLASAAEADKRDAVQEALEGLALIFEARAIAPFPQTGSRDLRGFSFSQEWNAAREADKNSAAIIRTYAQSLAIAAQKEAGEC